MLIIGKNRKSSILGNMLSSKHWGQNYIAIGVGGLLQAEAQKVLLPAVGNERILELKNIMQADFFLQRFNNDRGEYE